MNLSLSVRIAEGFLSKEEAILSLREVAALANSTGYEAICMRASQIGVQSPEPHVKEAVRILREQELPVSMLTGDFDTVYNNERGPASLRRIEPYLDLAEKLGAPLIRVALKESGDIAWARRAADKAKDRNIGLAHQCHSLSLFETIDGIEQTLRAINRDNFGLIYEPANLEICGQTYGPESVERLAPWIFNVYFQNQRLIETGAITLNTWCRGPVRFDLLPIHKVGGIDFESVFEGLRRINYDRTITVHQSAMEGESPHDSARLTAAFLKERMG